LSESFGIALAFFRRDAFFTTEWFEERSQEDDEDFGGQETGCMNYRSQYTDYSRDRKHSTCVYNKHISSINPFLMLPQNLLPNNISTPLTPHPNLMPPPSLNIEPPAHPNRLLRRLRVVGVRHRQLATEDQVRRYAEVLVRRVVGIAV
jgi:hypothetical protein